MKKFVWCVVAVATVIVVGCKTMPNEQQVAGLSYAAGAGTAYACEFSKMSAEAKVITTNIMHIVRDVVPASNSTFVATWPVIAAPIIKNYVDAKKIDMQTAGLIQTTVFLAAQGADFLVARHEDWKPYMNLTSIITTNFCDGFLAVFEKYNVTCGFADCGDIKYDKEAYQFTKASVTVINASKFFKK